MSTAFGKLERVRGRELMQRLIDSLCHGVPGPLSEVITLSGP